MGFAFSRGISPTPGFEPPLLVVTGVRAWDFPTKQGFSASY
jgi:hypothetical protein